MLHQLETDDWILQAEALHFLGNNKVEQAREAVASLRDNEKSSPWIRGRALVALARIEGKVPTGEFVKWVAHDLAPLRAAAAEVLEEFGGTSAETWLDILLKDKEESVRLRAVAAQARRKKAAAWNKVDSLTRSVSSNHADLAARALALTGTEAALDRLQAVLAEPKQRTQALRGLAGITDEKLLPILFPLLNDLAEDDLAYGAVLSTLQQQDWEKVIVALKKFISSADEKSLRTAARIMTRLTRSPELGKPLREALEKAKDVTTIEAGLIALGARAMEPDQHHPFFSKHLKNPEASIRELAIRCLAHCRDLNLYTALEPSLKDEEPSVILAALAALLHQPPADAPKGQLVHYLQDPLSHPDARVRNQAYELLGHAGSKDDFRPALAALDSLLRGTDETLRAAAAKALGAIAGPDQISEVVQAQGYLAKWKVIGTFLNDEKNAGFTKVFPPEKTIDFEATYPSQYIWMLEGHRRDDKPIDREVGWTDGNVDQTDGRLVMSAQLPPPGSLAVGYAVCDLRVPTAREVILHIDGDDAFRVFLNDKKIAEKVAPYERRKDCIVEQPDIKIQLKAGNNRFFVKSSNIDYRWWVRLRLTNSQGIPIDFSAP